MIASCIDDVSDFFEVLFSFTPAPLSLELSERGSHSSWPHKESMPLATSLTKALPDWTQQPLGPHCAFDLLSNFLSLPGNHRECCGPTPFPLYPLEKPLGM